MKTELCRRSCIIVIVIVIVIFIVVVIVNNIVIVNIILILILMVIAIVIASVLRWFHGISDASHVCSTSCSQQHVQSNDDKPHESYGSADECLEGKEKSGK